MLWRHPPRANTQRGPASPSTPRKGCARASCGQFLLRGAPGFLNVCVWALDVNGHRRSAVCLLSPQPEERLSLLSSIFLGPTLLLSFSFPFHLFLIFGWFFPTENPGVRAPRLAPRCGFLDEPWLHLPSQAFMKSPSQTCSQRAGYGQRGARPLALAAPRAWEGVSPSPTPNSLSLEDGAHGGLQSPACAAPGRPLTLAEGHGTTIPSMHRPRALRPVRSVGELRSPACPGPPAAHTRISGLRSGRGRGPRRRGGAPGGGPCGLAARTAWPRAGRLLVCILGGRAASRSEAQRGRSRGDASSSGRG